MMAIPVRCNFIFVLVLGGILSVRAGGSECVPCDVDCVLDLQKDENGCDICSCNLPECEGLKPFWCSNPCYQQSCADYRLSGELDSSQCVPREGDAACQSGCGCPDGHKNEHVSGFPNFVCVAKDECGCADGNAPGGYLQLGYKYKKSDTVEVCECKTIGGRVEVKCVDDLESHCEVVNGCPCEPIKGRDGCLICTCRN